MPGESLHFVYRYCKQFRRVRYTAVILVRFKKLFPFMNESRFNALDYAQ
jgi:hypothetical protein